MAFSKKTLAALAALAVSGGALSACSSTPPKEQVAKAVETQSAASSSSMKTYLQVDPATALSFIKDAGGAGGEAPDAQTTKVIQTLLASSFTIETKTTDGTPLAKITDPTKLSYGVFMDNSGSRLLSFLSMDKNYFAQVDALKAATLTGLATEEQFNSMKQLVDVPFMKDLLEKKWITLDEALATKANKAMEEETKGSLQDPAKSAKLAEALNKSFMDNSTFTQEGDFIKADLSLKKAVNQFIPALKTLDAKAFTAEEEKELQQALGYLKDGATIPFFMKLENNNFKQVKVDTSAIAKAIDASKVTDAESKKTLAAAVKYPVQVVMDFTSDTPSLNVPTGATKVTEKDFTSLFGGFLATDNSTSGTPSEAPTK